MAPVLKEVLESLPLGCYAVADAGYTLSEHIQIPFTGSDRLDPVQDSFNYYLSQLVYRDGFWKISEQISNFKWENNLILRSCYKNPYGMCTATQLHHKRGSAI